MNLLKFLIVILFSTGLNARLLHIIHINDLHSYFKGYQDGRGGYARLKTQIDLLKAESKSRGIDSLILDGGDFGEGTSYFMTDNGADTIRSLGLFGVDASVIGNHDHLLGGNVLSKQIKTANISTKFVSANILQTPPMELNNLVYPYVDFEKSGIKIRVIGLSTDEPHFQYTLADESGKILDPIDVGIDQSDKAKNDGKELVIALTHIGVSFDKKLAKESSNINLIVGGHSHTRLDKELYVKNKINKKIPIVQAASHGLVVGSLYLDLKDDGSLEVVEYKLIDIKAPMPEDEAITVFINEVDERRNQLFNGKFNEIIGQSEIKLSGYENGHAVLKKSCWGKHMAKMAADATGADVGIHLAFFEGMMISPGAIRFGDLIDNFPHLRKYGDMGWQVATFKARGDVLKILLKAIIAVKYQLGFNFWGAKYSYVHFPEEIPYLGGYTYSWQYKIKGEVIDNKKEYKIALPSEIGFALKAMLKSEDQNIFPELTFTGIYYWPLMEKYVRDNSPLKCLDRSY